MYREATFDDWVTHLEIADSLVAESIGNCHIWHGVGLFLEGVSTIPRSVPPHCTGMRRGDSGCVVRGEEARVVFIG